VQKQEYDRDALWKRGRGRAGQLPRRLKVGPEVLAGKRILEVGCGFGEHTAAVAEMYQADAVGIDPWPRFKDGPYADVCQCHQADILSQADVATLGQFDFIASYDVLEHVRDPYLAVCNIAGLLKPAGKAFLKFNLYRGASASHVVHLIDFPWCHLILSPKEIEDLIYERYGVRRGPSWVNRATYAHYADWFEEFGLKAQAIWYDRYRMADSFYHQHIDSLCFYPRYELERNFMLATLYKPE